MNTTTARFLAAALPAAALLIAAPAPLMASEPVCGLEDTLAACWAKVQTQSLASETEEAVAASETGVDTAGANLATVARDFLSAFDFAGLLGAGTADDDEQGTAVVDLNFILPGEIRERNGQLKVVLDTEPSLYAPLKTAIEEGGGEDAADTISGLEGDLGDIGGGTATFSLNWRSDKLGRYFSAHRDLYETLFAATDSGELSVDRFLGFLQDAQELTENCTSVDGCDCIDAESCSFTQLAGGAAHEGAARELRSALEAAALQEAELAATRRRAMVAGRLADFARLVDNQPQLYFSASGAFKDRLVGPDELSVEVTYELPLAPNVNRFWKDRGGRPSKADLGSIRSDRAQRTALLADYRQYLDEREDELDSPDRFSFSLQYIDRDRLNVTLPGDDGARHEFPGSESLIVEAGWGRPIELKPDGTVRTRADLVASWEDVSDDPARRDRGLLVLTVTRDFGEFSVPFGIVVSNKPEFLAAQDVDEQLSAHIGIKYSVDGLGGD